MTASNQTFRGKAKLEPAGNIFVSKLDLIDPDTEYEYTLQDNLQQIEFASRTGHKIYFRFSDSSEYRTLERGLAYHLAGLNLVGKKLYIKSTATGIVEIVEVF